MWRAAAVLRARRGAPETPVKRRRHRSCASRILRTSPKESTRRTQDLWFSRGTDHHRRAVLPSTRHTRPPAAASAAVFLVSSILSPSGTIVSARGTTQVKCCRPSPQPASRWSPPSPLPLPPRPSWYLRIRCCALLRSAVSRESAERGPAGGGRAWGACCPVDAVGGP